MSSYTVLVVEDEDLVRTRIARMVTSCGFGVVTAAQGNAARQILLAQPIDIVVSDLHMPQLDGFGLLKWMRTNGYTQPLLVVSGNGMVESAIEALRLGAYDYILKPFSVEEVAAALRRAESSVQAHQSTLKLGQRNRELAALTAISAAGSSTLDLIHMLHETIPATMDVLGVGGAAVYLSDMPGRFGLHTRYGKLSPQSASMPATLRSIHNSRPLIGHHAVATALDSMGDGHTAPFVDSTLAALVPLQARGDMAGLVVLTHPIERPIASDQRDLLRSIGNIIGVGVANARMYGAVYTSAILLEEQISIRTREVQRSRDLLRTIFDGIPNGLVLLDHQGIVLAANRACASILNQTLKRLVGATYSTMWPEDHIGTTAEMLQQCMLRGEPIKRRARIQHDGCSPIVLDCYLFPVGSVIAGEPMQVIEYLDNVTERLALEQVVAQTEQLAALGKLAATVAHEVNTPLLAIRGCVSLASDAGDEETRNEYLSLAQGELDRAASIIRGLLDFYRPTGQNHMGTDLNALANQVLQLLHAECLHNNIDVETQLDAHLPDVFGSPDQLKQVLLNLVLNALEAMDSGGQLLVRSFPTQVTSQGEIHPYSAIEVCDNGSGIPDEILNRLFDAFVTTKDDGNGLGLAVCRSIVRDHGGIIEASNRPGGGSSFVVKLPILSQASAARSAARIPQPMYETTSEGGYL